MAFAPWRRCLFIFFCAQFVPFSRAQVSIPPLQWLNLTPLLGTAGAPPPLKDASITWDSASQYLIIFGGESQAGLPTQDTFALNLKTLQWDTLTTVTTKPPKRSAALYGADHVSNMRNCFLVWGGKGDDQTALGDLWAFDFQNQYWAEIPITSSSLPAPRWGASGGTDPTFPNITTAGHTSFVASGGSNQGGALSATDVWVLSVQGTIALNVPGGASASWIHPKTLSSGGAPVVGQASAVVSQPNILNLVTYGGCNDTKSSSFGPSCAIRDGHGLTFSNLGFSSAQWTSTASCPSPRYGAVLAQNLNNPSAWPAQTFLILGSEPPSDNSTLAHGEVDVLDVNGGTWTRVLPAGDPSSSPQQPTPREGAAVVSIPGTIAPGIKASDIIMFGGKDVATNLLTNEIWLLRSYNGAVSSSTDHWSGFGDGKLKSGLNADGTGVTVQFLTPSCASLVPPPGGSSTPRPPSVPSTLFETSTLHRSLSPISVALFLPSFLLFRVAAPGRLSVTSLSVSLGIVAYALGVAGFAISLTTTRITSSTLHKRSFSQSAFLKTTHGQAGLGLFICLYGVFPICLLLATRTSPWHSHTTNGEVDQKVNDPGMELTPGSEYTPETEDPTEKSPHRSRRFLQSGLFRSLGGSSGLADEDVHSEASHGGFEVMNRTGAGRSVDTHQTIHNRNFSDLSWIDRRRNLHAASEIDYALSHPATAIPTPSGVASPMPLTHRTSSTTQTAPSRFPPLVSALIHTLLHAIILFACLFSLIALKSLAPIGAFVGFLIWVLIFYTSIIILAWYGHPNYSILSTVFARLRQPPPPRSLPPSSPTPLPDIGPYLHQPPSRRAPASIGETLDALHRPSQSNPMSARSVDLADEDDGDEDDDERQRRMEQEMARRDVSIVTIPKRRLMIANE